MPTVWIFTKAGARFPAGVFSQREKAEHWIRKHESSGTLAAYPVDVGLYDWVIGTGTRWPQRAAEYIRCFSSASQEHYHYENGKVA